MQSPTRDHGLKQSSAPRRDAEIAAEENPEKPAVPVRESRGTSPMDR